MCCSFFLENDSLGLSRAQVATQVLLELNPHVRGDYIDEAPEQLLNHNPEFFNSFSLVIATSLAEKYVYILILKRVLQQIFFCIEFWCHCQKNSGNSTYRCSCVEV